MTLEKLELELIDLYNKINIARIRGDRKAITELEKKEEVSFDRFLVLALNE